MVVCLRRSTYDHLGALPGGCKLWRMAVDGQLLFALRAGNCDLLHGPENGMPPFVRGQQVQALLTGQLHIHAQAVGQISQLLQQFRACAGDGLGVDVAPKAVFAPQQPQGGQHPFGGVVRRAQYRAGKEQPFNVVAAVKLPSQLSQFPGREGGTGDIVGLAVDAIAAVEGTAVGHEHL